MTNIKKNIKIEEKLACITLDFEKDYGGRIGESNLLDNENELYKLKTLFFDMNIPISIFITTDILINYPKSLDFIKSFAQDFHCHSHTHDLKKFDNKREICDSALTFEKYFGYNPLGYRAPKGVLYKNDINIIKKCGFEFSSSIFPSYRPGNFNNLTMPLGPFFYNNGIVEFPFAAIPKLRYTISLSYLKLLSYNFNKILFSIFGLPNVIVFDSHLHDFIINEKSFNKLPSKMRFAWGINKYSGVKYFKSFISFF